MELDFVAHVRDQVRTLLKIRSEREIPSEGSKPPFGAKLVCGDIRMTVRSGMTDQLWSWLLDQGWREVFAPGPAPLQRYPDGLRYAIDRRGDP